MKNGYAIVQSCFGVWDPQFISGARVISRHRTIRAARKAYDAAHRRLRRQPGQEHSWYDWQPVAIADGELRRLTEDEGEMWSLAGIYG